MDIRTRRQLRLFDGLHLSFRMLEHYHQLLYPACLAIPANPQSVVGAFAAAWGFVDSLHRLRELARSVPGLGGKERSLVRFIEATRLAEDFRHYVQHLRQELAVVEDRSDPVWGSLSWADPDDALQSHTVLFGTHLPGVSFTGAVFDRQEGRWVSRVCLGAEGRSFHFDPVFEEARLFEGFLTPWLLARSAGSFKLVETLPILTTRIVPGNA